MSLLRCHELAVVLCFFHDSTWWSQLSMVGHSVNVQGFVWVDEIQFAPPKKPDDTIPPKKMANTPYGFNHGNSFRAATGFRNHPYVGHPP